MPRLICFGLDNYAHAQTVDTRPFFLGRLHSTKRLKQKQYMGTTCLQSVAPTFFVAMILWWYRQP